MLVLGIETSTPQASVTIGSEQGIIGSCTISRGAAYGEFLLPAVEFLMHQSGLTYRQLSAVAIGLGPGLFTGMRVGVTTAKTLAQALSVPIIGVPSLDLLAFDARYTPKVMPMSATGDKAKRWTGSRSVSPGAEQFDRERLRRVKEPRIFVRIVR